MNDGRLETWVLRALAAAGFLLIFALLGMARAEVPAYRTYNPDVTEDTKAKTICVAGYTAQVRPPLYITQLIKKRLLEAQGKTWDDAKNYELDHIIPLYLGGEPGDLDHTSNFQLQLWPEAKRKDRVEAVAGQCVCNGQVPLDEARADLEDWQAAYKKYAAMVCRRPR